MALGNQHILVVALLCSSYSFGQRNTTSTTPESTSIVSGNHTVAPPSPSPSVHHSSTYFTPSHVPTTLTSTSLSTTVSPTHNKTTSVPHPSATTLPGNATSSVLPTTGNVTIPTTAPPTPDCHKIKDELKAETRYKWVATAFALIFAFVIIVLVIALCRMRRIYRELEGDSSLSRLI